MARSLLPLDTSDTVPNPSRQRNTHTNPSPHSDNNLANELHHLRWRRTNTAISSWNAEQNFGTRQEMAESERETSGWASSRAHPSGKRPSQCHHSTGRA